MQYTNNYGLKKPEDSDVFDQQEHANYNYVIIDQKLKEVEDKASNAAVLGHNDQALNKVKAATLNIDTRTIHRTYDPVTGYLTMVTAKDGETLVKTTAYTYGPVTGYLATKAETAGGVTVTTTYVYDENSNLVDETKAVE